MTSESGKAPYGPHSQITFPEVTTLASDFILPESKEFCRMRQAVSGQDMKMKKAEGRRQKYSDASKPFCIRQMP
jgi:hypothetical protein